MVNHIFIALGLGIVAAILDVIPMIIQKRPRFTIYSMFLQWVFLGLVIPFVDWDVEPWLKGLILGLSGMMPATITVFYNNRPAVLSTLIFGGLFGMAISIVASNLIS